MSEVEAAAVAADNSAVSPTAPIADVPLETTTPEEVSQILSKAGYDLGNDEEEGIDPDAPEVSDQPEITEPEPEPEAEEPEEVDEEVVEEPETDEVAPPKYSDNEDKYSFEVTDANGVTFKIPVGAKMEDILSEFEPKNNGQVLDILKQLSDLESLKNSDEAQAAEEAAQAETTAQATKIRQGWEAEAKVLQGAKRIPEGDDGEKRINAVYEYMAKENDARMKVGKPTINSFEDALDKLENKEARDKAAADAKAEKEQARKNGGLVGGASAPASNSTPVYKAGSARNANEALRAMGLLE